MSIYQRERHSESLSDKKQSARLPIIFEYLCLALYALYLKNFIFQLNVKQTEDPRLETIQRRARIIKRNIFCPRDIPLPKFAGILQNVILL